ncbi:hypothetical protein FHX49_001708 [Microbacterium endophyticum]|uniref:Uncharacterized protein n=1 Tax=Microbacterium endophyticum TaxID=1526412 RepID=A0A7W4V3D0_9MICO|nr:hypothetical protein [Microbacterium endophyticum]MBB2976138.1 hypothetical protein [Microbacterium endophyticum]NIK36435.1 hypothetical protein [Microbacterium endophyticum]
MLPGAANQIQALVHLVVNKMYQHFLDRRGTSGVSIGDVFDVVGLVVNAGGIVRGLGA